jgi:accessory Sec system S-layer assembly protein
MDLFKLKNKAKKVKENEQTVASSNGETVEPETDLRQTTLSFAPSMKISPEDQYIYRFYHNELSLLKPNQLSIAAIESNKTAMSITVKALIRHTIDKEIELGETDILLLDGAHKIVAEKTINLSRMGKMPANTARPWIIKFSKQDFDDFLAVDPDNVSLAFRVKKSHALDLDDQWKEALSNQQVTALENIVARAPELKAGELNIMAVEAKTVKENTIAVTVLIRNGSQKAIQIEQLPLRLYDKNKQVVAEGGFKLEGFSVKPNTSKPKTLIFNEPTIKQTDYDLSSFSVQAVQNS